MIGVTSIKLKVSTFILCPRHTKRKNCQVEEYFMTCFHPQLKELVMKYNLPVNPARQNYFSHIRHDTHDPLILDILDLLMFLN